MKFIRQIRNLECMWKTAFDGFLEVSDGDGAYNLDHMAGQL